MQCKWSIILFWVNTHRCLKLTHYSGLYGHVHAASLILGNLVLILGSYMQGLFQRGARGCFCPLLGLICPLGNWLSLYLIWGAPLDLDLSPLEICHNAFAPSWAKSWNKPCYMYQGMGTCLEHYDLFLSGAYFVSATKHSHALILIKHADDANW